MPPNPPLPPWARIRCGVVVIVSPQFGLPSGLRLPMRRGGPSGDYGDVPPVERIVPHPDLGGVRGPGAAVPILPALTVFDAARRVPLSAFVGGDIRETFSLLSMPEEPQLFELVFRLCRGVLYDRVRAALASGLPSRYKEERNRQAVEVRQAVARIRELEAEVSRLLSSSYPGKRVREDESGFEPLLRPEDGDAPPCAPSSRRLGLGHPGRDADPRSSYPYSGERSGSVPVDPRGSAAGDAKPPDPYADYYRSLDPAYRRGVGEPRPSDPCAEYYPARDR